MMSALVSPEWDVLDEAMSEFIADIVVAKSKTQKLRRNMECRRRVEKMLEEKRLRRELREYDFEYASELDAEIRRRRTH
ncbi:PA3496 family putative envelope integrity protein [Cellvibrio japonicus]|nr:hypothetical protein [Cellvibrio japonicus]QEI12231.1 hypothetical protein FY117_08330 [Cellvibrio japonicus]QEI15805.1 hypothetical protein FY116_08335 [Cellvibrio japonicus]QEI19383.1 hypothetical protein FY115_08330 [Cellvibrio japonicus]